MTFLGLVQSSRKNGDVTKSNGDDVDKHDTDNKWRKQWIDPEFPTGTSDTIEWNNHLDPNPARLRSCSSKTWQ